MMTQAIIQAVRETMEAIVQMTTQAAGPAEGNRETPTVVSVKASGLSLKQLSFDWKVKDNYAKLLNFNIEIKMFSDKELQFPVSGKPS